MTITTAQLSAIQGRTSLARVTGGRTARREGDEWEALVARSCADLIQLERIPNGAKWIGPGKTIGIKSPFDYCGTVRVTGRAIMFDAKSLGDKYASFPLDNERIVHPHQASALCRHAQAGAISGLLVRCGRCHDYRWLDGRHLLPAVRIGWEDARWIVLGPAGDRVEMGRLMEAYR